MDGVHAERPTLVVALISGESWTKCAGTMAGIFLGLDSRTRLLVICGEVDPEPFPQLPRTSHVLLEGSHVYDIRAALPEIVGDCDWVALIEDHAMPHRGWVKATLEAIDAMPAEEQVFTGTVANTVSTGDWDWPNFLFNFTAHWNPSRSGRLAATVTTLVVRRSVLADRALGKLAFEELVLGRPGPVVNSVVVDHIQHVDAWTASVHVFDNGLVAGEGNRRNSPQPLRQMLKSVRYFLGLRIHEMNSIIDAHPLRETLPRNTLPRLRWIATCHAAGFVLGTLFGSGRAAHRLE